MASVRQISMLFIFVALLCHFGQAHGRDKRHVGGLFKILENILHPLDLKYLRFRQRFDPSRLGPVLKSNDNIEFLEDIWTPWEKLDDFEDSQESDGFLSNSFEVDDGFYENSKEDDFKNISKEKYDDSEEELGKNNKGEGKYKNPKHDEPKSKPNGEKQNTKLNEGKFSNNNPYFYVFDEIEKLKRVIQKENSYESPESFLLYLFKTYGFNQDTYGIYIALQSLFPPINPLPYAANPGAPKINTGPSFIPKAPLDVRNKGAPYTYPPDNILGNLIPKINHPPSYKPNGKKLFPDLNGGLNNRFNPLMIPNYGKFGNKGRPNYVPIGGSIIDGYYPSPWQQMYYLVQLSNGQVILVPKEVLFGPNKGPLAPGYGPVLFPNNNPLFGPNPYIPSRDYDDYQLPFNYGFDKRFVPSGLRKPRKIQSGYQVGSENNEQHHEAVPSTGVKDEAELSSPEHKNKEIDAKEDNNKESKDNNYNIKYD